MPKWQFIAVDSDGGTEELGDATKRQVTWRLSDSCNAGFNLDGYSDQAPLIEELITDVKAIRDGLLLFRGRVGVTSDDIDADGYDLSVDVVDYRGLLARRILWPTFTAIASGYTAVDQVDIAWDLIADSQALPGGDLGITQGLSPSGTARDRSVGYYTAGKNLEEALSELAAVINGFDWEISPDLELNIWHPTRGRAADFAVSFDESGGNVTKISRSVDPAGYADALRYSGADGVAASTQVAADIATRPEGRFERQEGKTDLTSATSVTEAAQQLLADVSTILPSYKFTFSPDAAWDPTSLWLGDTCPIRIKRGRLDVNTVGRVIEITADIGDNDNETISVTFDRPPVQTREDRNARLVVGRVEGLARR